jgi:heptosyltransferase III
MGRTLAVRLDSDGDVLLTGPALTALAATGDQIDLLVSPQGDAAGRLLPAVSDVIVFAAPWSGFAPPPVDAAATQTLIAEIARRRYDRAVVFTSFHQSPLPAALLLRLAGVPFLAAASADYPGSLLDVRVRRDDPPGGGHEVEAALDLAIAAGAPSPEQPPRLDVRRPVLDPGHLLPPAVLDAGYVVVHPGASVPARALGAAHAAAIVRELASRQPGVVVTGGTAEQGLVDHVVGEAGAPGTVNLGGRTSLAELAGVLDGARVVVVGNTGPAHLAAAVGTPVVSLFSPVVPAARWAPWGVPSRLLGDQHAACRDTRARDCPIPGHPCLTSIAPGTVADAVDALIAEAAKPREPACAF